LKWGIPVLQFPCWLQPSRSVSVWSRPDVQARLNPPRLALPSAALSAFASLKFTLSEFHIKLENRTSFNDSQVPVDSPFLLFAYWGTILRFAGVADLPVFTAKEHLKAFIY
jgi:hypothetical protein